MHVNRRISKRGFSNDWMIELAILVVFLAAAFPVSSRVYEVETRRGVGIVAAAATAVGAFTVMAVMAFLVTPLALALPCTSYAKLRRTRTEPFLVVLHEYWGYALCLLFGGAVILGLGMLRNDIAVRPIIHLFHH